MFGYQNSAQIEMLYGRAGMMALLGMAFTQICFASTDPAIQKHLEEQCGYAEIERITENMPSHLLSGSKHSRSSSITSQQVSHDPVVMATEIGQLPPYEFVMKQRDMVRCERIQPNHRRPQYLYRRRQIPEMVLIVPPADDEEGVPVDEEELVPVDEPVDVKRAGRPKGKKPGPGGPHTVRRSERIEGGRAMSKLTQQPDPLVAAAAVSEFAERWDKKLWGFAKKVTCHCTPVNAGDDESDHGPDCPVGLFRQAGRLMCEEASMAVEAAAE